MKGRDFKKYPDPIKRIRTLYFNLLWTVVLLAIVSFFIIHYRVMGEENNMLALEWLKILIIVSPLSMAMGYGIFRIKLKNIAPEDTLDNKLQQYFTAAALRMVLFAIPAALLYGAAWVSAQLLFLIIAPFILLGLLLIRPSKQTIADEINLSPGERERLK